MKRRTRTAGASRRVRVVFRPSGKEARLPLGSLLSRAARSAGIATDSSCGGRGRCGKCRARIIKGKVSDITQAEKRVFTAREIDEKTILLCQRQALGNCILELDMENALDLRLAPSKGDLLEGPLETDPFLSKVYCELTPPTTQDQRADLERVLHALAAALVCDLDLLLDMSRTLREADYKVTLAVFRDELIGIERGDTTRRAYGIAVDLGTTTVAGYLVDLVKGTVMAAVSAANKQAIHGADVVSRITYARRDKERVREMQALAVDTVDGIIRDLLGRHQMPSEHVYSLTFTGNTVMNHFLLGVSPEHIALAPFVPVFTRPMWGRAARLGLGSLPSNARFVVLPNIAGFVGADTVSLMVATKIHERRGHWLAIDIGTNGELVLSGNGRLLTCSTAAGPAFEGGCIKHGMCAISGAVSRVDFAEDVLVSVVGEGKPAGVCGSGLVDAVSEMLRVGILHANGRILTPEECPEGLARSLGARVRQTELGLSFVLARGKKDVAITQKDIRELQLAKGAIRAGIEILLKELDLQASQLDGILLAGAFGSNLRPESLMRIGLLPPLPLERVHPVGNAAATGAVMALLSKRQHALALLLAEKAEHVELSRRKDFQKAFVAAMNFEAN